MAGFDKPIKGALSAMRAVPREEVVSPLAQLIAARMAGQLQGVTQLPNMGALSKLNLPAAYAGDQRSLQAVQRGIRGAETGLESPGRRKILKQGAATAARAMVPDVLADTAGTSLLKKAVGDAMTPSIPDESIQAAIAAAMKKVLSYEELIDSPSAVQDIMEGAMSPRDLAEWWGVPVSKAKRFIKDVEQAQTPLIEQKWGFPAGTIDSYIEKQGHGLHPQSAIDQWLQDSGLGDLPEWGAGITPNDMSDDVKTAIKEAYRAAGKGWDEGGSEAAYKVYTNAIKEAQTEPIRKLIGESNYRHLNSDETSIPSLDRGMEYVIDSHAEYADDLWNELHKIATGE